MQRHIISVNSITYAIKGRDLLRKQGFNAYIERKTAQNGDSGCGYVIVVNGNRQKVVAILKNSGIAITNVNTVA